MNIHEKLRLCTISRWGMVNTSKHQSVAEHSFNVALIASELIWRMGRNLSIPAKRLIKDTLAIAIQHDMMEVLVGDIPSPTKSLISAHCGDNWHHMMHDVDPEEYAKCREGDPMLRAVVKCADYIEAIAFLDMYGVGGQSKKVVSWLEMKFFASLKSYKEKYAELDWTHASELLEEIRREQ